MNKDEKKESGSGAEKKNDHLEARSARLNMSFWVINETATKFDVEDGCLYWGKWMSSFVPIPAHSSRMLAFRSCGAMGSATGTEGWVRYFVSGGAGMFIVKWDIPYSGDGYLVIERNKEADAFYNFTISHYDRKSDDPNPVLTIINKK